MPNSSTGGGLQMLCSNCQVELEPGAKFCQACAAPTGENLPPAVTPDPENSVVPDLHDPVDKIPKQSNYLKPIVVIALAFILFIGFVAYKTVLAPKTSSDIAQEFAAAMKSGNYEEAYEMFDTGRLQDSSFTDKDAWVEACQNADGLSFTVLANSKPDEEQTVTSVYTFVMKANGETYKDQITLDKVTINGKKSWQVDPSVFIVKSTVSSAYDGISTSVNDTAVKCGRNTSCSLETFIFYPLTVVFDNPYLNPHTPKGT